MAPFPIPKLITQSVAAVYNPLKDLFLYLKGKRQDIKDLEERIRTLIIHLTTIMSRNEEIDRYLKTSVSEEKTKECEVMQANIDGILKQCNKFVNKYNRITGNDLPILRSELEVSKVELMISKLEEFKSKIWTLNFRKLAKLSRKIEKLSRRADGVLKNLNVPKLIRDKSQLNQEKFNDDIDLPVFDGYVEKVLDYLSERGNRSVGIVGPVGVGKTIVMRKLYNRLIETKSLSVGENSSWLDNIIWIEYPLHLETEEKIVEKVQNDIMVQLNINHKSTIENANSISNFLCEKKYIMLMDQVLNYSDLEKLVEKLGLRKHHAYKNVVIASSDKKAISKMTEYEVEIQRLSEDDPRKLFENIHGKIHSSLIEIADSIIECCGGLPLMINLVAKHLKKKNDKKLWYAVKRNLQRYSKSHKLIDLGGIDNIYEMMYEELGVPSKKCLLYGALFPNEHKIYKDYLIECWIAEGFIVEDVIQKLRCSRESGEAILDRLTDFYLLEWCLDKRHVKMPLNLKRVALELQHRDEKNGVIWVPSNDKEPGEDTWNIATRISLIGCKTMLPESPKCCNIHTLLLQLKPELERLAENFFFHMENLQVLDLNHTEIRALPGSICRLVNLRSLYLNGCHHLAMLPPGADKLEKLQFLDISGTSIPSLPQEIRFMVDLRCLRASFSSKRNDTSEEVEDPECIIPSDIISNLGKLEELSIDIGLHNQDMIDIVMEMAGLKYLTTLCFNFPKVGSLDTFVTNSESFKNIETDWGTDTFESFKIFVGRCKAQYISESDVSGMLAEKRLRFATNEEFSSACKEILKQACAFEIIGHHRVETLSQFDLDSLQICVVEHCNKLKSIVEYSEMEGDARDNSSGVLQNLEKLHLYDLQLLECIWKGQVPSQSLINLTALTLNGCPMLTKILDPTLARTLRSLEYLKVENCCKVSEIVGVSEGSNNAAQEDRCKISEIVEVHEGSSSLEQETLSDILKSVRIIELSDLPQLESICQSTSISWNSLKSICITRCKKLSNLSLTQGNAKKLALIQCEKGWWDQLKLLNEVKQRFEQPADGVKQRSQLSFWEDSSELGSTSPEGEASTTETSDFNQASSDIERLVADHGREEIAEQITSSNNCPIDHPASNMDVDNGTRSPKDEMPISDDVQASNINGEADGPRPDDEIHEDCMTDSSARLNCNKRS